MLQKYQAKVAQHQLLVGSFHYLHLELINPPRIQFQAGQYLILTIDEVKGIRRNYSIASSPSMNHAIELLVDLKPQGPGSKFFGNLQPGDEVEFVGPVGNFVAKDDSNPKQELVFVATGSGIAPTRAMILDQLTTKKNTSPIRLWWGMRNQADCFWVEEFDLLAKEHPNFKWDLILSQPPENWPLHSGHVTEHVLNFVQNEPRTTPKVLEGSHEPRAFYLCGNRQMIEELSTKLKETGIKDEQIHFEKFY